jgi:NAD(P)-dependent dehydrogenase (short-subunit alcohol dehydrogenase family)
MTAASFRGDWLGAAVARMPGIENDRVIELPDPEEPKMIRTVSFASARAGLVILLLCLAFAGNTQAAAHRSGFKLPPPPENLSFGEDYVPTVLVTGSNRGIGLAFVEAYAKEGWKVIATCRRPDDAAELKAIAARYPGTVVVEALDVADFAQVDALAARYRGQPVDILLNNAGISGGSENQMFGKMDFDVYSEVLRVNTIAPLKIAEAFFEHVQASREKKIMTVSSSQGSIGMVDQPRLYFYRASKAALNMEMKNLSLQLKRRGITVGMVNPGMTDTDFMAGLPKRMLRPAEEAAIDMMRNIDLMTVETTGGFLQYDGEQLPW